MQKKLILILLLSAVYCFSFSQFNNYRNQWIDYSKSYYKFLIGPFGTDVNSNPVTNGVVRISAAALANAGVGSVPAEQLQLWRNGEEIPIYTSRSTGVFGSNDYIEFWGEINDGIPDHDLYPNPAFQTDDHSSLETDSAAYFLTVNPSGNNKRFTPAINATFRTSMKADKNFMYTASRFYRGYINYGYAVVDVVNLYSATYDRGEGFASRPIHPNACGCGGDFTYSLSPLYLDNSSAGKISVSVKYIGNSPNFRFVETFINNNFLGAAEMDYYNDSLVTYSNIPAGSIAGDNVTFLMRDSSSNQYDEIRLGRSEITYPHLFNFGNSSSFEFKLSPAAQKGRLIKIINFNKGASLPVLYDMSNGLRYNGDTLSEPGSVKFLLNSSSKEYNLVLVRGDGSTATNVTSLAKRNFIDYNAKNNQGNYLIISNPVIYGSGSDNYVEQYRAYRASAAGGSYNSKTVDINEITDQFAYGISKHPLAIKNFLQFARKNFTTPPAYVFLIGKGVTYDAYFANKTNALDNKLDLVQTWGYPGSDNLLSSKDYTAIPATPIGRLSAVSPQEVGNYLNKVKQYEKAQQDSVQTFENKGWMKNVLQLVGADDQTTGIILDRYMQNYKEIISDTLFGANVLSYSKTADPSGYSSEVANFKNTFNAGSSLVTYFGHSSSTRLDFNLDNPSDYNNAGKYPMFIVNGCLAGNIFDFDLNRLNLPSTISEKFVLQPNGGAIGYLATSSYGISNYLNIFTKRFYKAIAYTSYGKGFGVITQDGITRGLNFTGLEDFYGRLQAEEYTYQGDPALSVNSFTKPDYTIDSSDFKITPAYISEADNSVQLKIYINNIGRATDDSVHFTLTRQYPSGDKEVVFTKWFPNIKSNDSAVISLPLVADRDKGINKLTATIDDKNTVSEISEKNNSSVVNFTVASSEIRPVYPYNYSVITKDDVLLYASTADPLADTAKYVAEADTTALFNSPVKKSFTITSSGGVLKFGKLQLPLDNTVYYWRAAKNNTDKHWYNFSFVHNSTGSAGFAQSHFYQHTQSSFNNIELDSISRKFVFGKSLTNVFINHTIYPTGGEEDADFAVSVNGVFATVSACVGSSIIFNVFDSVLFKPWVNTKNVFGAGAVCKPDRAINFEYSTLSAGMRDSAVKFFDSIPNGSYVIAREIYNIGDADWAPTVWAKDTALYGHNNSLYHRFKSQGLPIDSFYYPRTFIFLFRKNDTANYKPLAVFTDGIYDYVTLSDNIKTTDTIGYITSPAFGPAKSWNNVMWNGFAPDATDVQSLQVIGIKSDGTKKVLYTLNDAQHSADISGTNANVYPYMQLQLKTQDSVKVTPYQLQKWNVSYAPASEAGVAPNLGINLADTFTYFHGAHNKTFDSLAGFVSFKNVSNVRVDALKAMIILIDKANKADTFFLPDTKSILPGDTINLSFIINVSKYPTDTYNFYLKVFPTGKKPFDQYSFNNSLYKYIYINRIIISGFEITFDANPSELNINGNWIVRNNAAVAKYELQRSTDGINFTGIGEVLQSSAEQNKFSITDKQPATGKNFYRVKATNKDKTINYSATREVDFNVKSDVEVYPNPFTKTLNIFLADKKNKNVVVKIVNARGQTVYQKSFAGGVISIDGAQFASGNYLVVTDDGIEQKTFKVQKQ